MGNLIGLLVDFLVRQLTELVDDRDHIGIELGVDFVARWLRGAVLVKRAFDLPEPVRRHKADHLRGRNCACDLGVALACSFGAAAQDSLTVAAAAAVSALSERMPKPPLAVVASTFGGTAVIACSLIAVMVRLGF